MDIAIYKNEKLVVCCEVKEKASQLGPLLASIKKFESGFDANELDRHNDGLRKAKYIVKTRPQYFALVAIGQAMEFSVTYPSGSSFILTEDLIPIW